MRSQITDGAACLSSWSNSGMPKQSEGTHNPSQSSLRRWDNDGGAPAGGRTKRPKESEPAAEGQGKNPAVVVGRESGLARAKSLSKKRRSAGR